MNKKLAIAILMLFSFVAVAYVTEKRKSLFVSAPHLAEELEELKRVYKKGGLDEMDYEARREILVTIWELMARDQQSR